MELTNLRDRFPDEPQDGRGRALQAAAELFTGLGYAGTSTDAIARAAGLKPAALYRLFESKEHLLYVFLEQIYEGFLEDMRVAVGEETDPAVQLARLAWAHTWVQLSFGTLPRAHIGTMFSVGQLLASLSDERALRLRALARAHLEHCRTIVESGVRLGRFDVPDARSSALAVTTMCEYSPMWFRPGHVLGPEEVADRHALYALRLVATAIEDLPAFAAAATGRADVGAGPPADERRSTRR